MYELKRKDDGQENPLKIRGLKSHLLRSAEAHYLSEDYKPRGGRYFHGRDVGECPRSIVLRWLGIPAPPPSVQQRWRMEDGLYAEERVRGMYQSAGLISHSNIRLKRTYIVGESQVTVAGVADIILRDTTLVEVKAPAERNFERWKVVEDLPRQTRDQANLYCKQFELLDGLIHLHCRGSNEFRILPFPRDDERNWYQLYRFVEIQEAYVRKELPAFNHDDYWCKYGEACKERGPEVFGMSGNPTPMREVQTQGGEECFTGRGLSVLSGK